MRILTKAARTSGRPSPPWETGRLATLALSQDTISWHQITRLKDSSSAQRLLFYRVKGLRLSGWDRHAGLRGCPHTGHTYHIVWHCTTAHLLWDAFRTLWARLGVFADQSADGLCTAIFSLRPPHTPAVVWTLIDHRGVTPDEIIAVHAVITDLWRQQCLSCLQRIWQWRHGLHDVAVPWTTPVALSAFRGAMRGIYSRLLLTLQSQGRPTEYLQRMLRGLQLLQVPGDAPAAPRSSLPSDQFLLFFDGGSRGNPGPGGSGAVIVQVDAYGGQPRLVWAAAMSLSNPTTTNNQAEYFGLVTGLRAASHRRLVPISVIGDSALIIAQLKTHRAPRDPTLKRLYAAARVAADKLQVLRWHHHVRSFNKMADAAANRAMDSRQSFQTHNPTAHEGWAGVATHLAGDVAQWQASTSPGPTSLG